MMHRNVANTAIVLESAHYNIRIIYNTRKEGLIGHRTYACAQVLNKNVQ